MNEIIDFGPGRRLIGVLTGDAPAHPGPILLLPSAGLQPRSGPFRLHVELGEMLAAGGIRTFRFDVPGVGEAPRFNGFDSHAATLAAIDALEAACGPARFVVGGICSAADMGWKAAVHDKRVSAVLLLDGICFTGPWFQYARTVDRLRRLPREWPRMLRGLPDHFQESDGLATTDFRDWPTHGEARRQFSELVARGVKQLWIYTGGYTDRFLHRRQFGWTFGPPARSPDVTMHYWPDCDHTFFARAHRDRLLRTVNDWMVGLCEASGTGA